MKLAPYVRWKRNEVQVIHQKLLQKLQLQDTIPYINGAQNSSFITAHFRG